MSGKNKSIHCSFLYGLWLWFMVFNATFKNISVISWRSVLLVEETGENYRPVVSHGQTLSHNVSSTLRLSEVELPSLVVIGTHCTCSCKFNYHTITNTTVPILCMIFTGKTVAFMRAVTL